MEEYTGYGQATASPVLTVQGVFRGGKLVKAEWSGATHQLSDRTLAALQAMGVTINDNPADYIWTGQVL